MSLSDALDGTRGGVRKIDQIFPNNLPRKYPRATASPAGFRSDGATQARTSPGIWLREGGWRAWWGHVSRLAWGGTGLPRDQSLPTPLSSPPGMLSARSFGWEDAVARLARPVWGCGRHGEAACVLGNGGVLVRAWFARRCGEGF